tara:strand:- start:200 stop:475 length:276 start_codon:yes stop_codon:yes gene_type:complete
MSRRLYELSTICQVKLLGNINEDTDSTLVLKRVQINIRHAKINAEAKLRDDRRPAPSAALMVLREHKLFVMDLHNLNLGHSRIGRAKNKAV